MDFINVIAFEANGWSQAEKRSRFEFACNGRRTLVFGSPPIRLRVRRVRFFVVVFFLDFQPVFCVLSSQENVKYRKRVAALEVSTRKWNTSNLFCFLVWSENLSQRTWLCCLNEPFVGTASANQNCCGDDFTYGDNCNGCDNNSYYNHICSIKNIFVEARKSLFPWQVRWQGEKDN